MGNPAGMGAGDVCFRNIPQDAMMDIEGGVLLYRQGGQLEGGEEGCRPGSSTSHRKSNQEDKDYGMKE